MQLDETMSALNLESVMSCLDNPQLFDRIEECVVNARTELAKRRLVRATIVLSSMKQSSAEMNSMAGWDQLL